MLSYIVRRLLLMVPLIFGITLISFTVIHLAPGGPVEVETEMSMKPPPRRAKTSRSYTVSTNRSMCSISIGSRAL